MFRKKRTDCVKCGGLYAGNKMCKVFTENEFDSNDIMKIMVDFYCVNCMPLYDKKVSMSDGKAKFYQYMEVTEAGKLKYHR